MLRLITHDDIDYLVELEMLNQFHPWTAETFKQCLSIGSKGWVLQQNEVIIGFIFLLVQSDEAHILNLGVHPNCQNKGLGFKLMQHVLQNLQNEGVKIAYLEVRRSNFNAIQLYKKCGFLEMGFRKNYYISQNGFEDALLFAKELGKG